MKRDILFLCQFFYPEHNSSATLPFDTAKHLAAQGFTVDALCGYPKEYSEEKDVPLRETKDGVGIRRLRYLQLPRGKKLSRLVNYFSFTASVLLRLFRLGRYRSIIVYSNPPILPIAAVLAKILFRTRLVFVAYDLYPEIAYASGSIAQGSLVDRGMRLINRMMFKRADRVVALTEEMKRFILENREGIVAERIAVIPNWAHEKRAVQACGAHERFGFSEDDFIVSYFGNMGIVQEMETLMDAVERMRDHARVRFLFVGHGSKKDAIAARIREKNLTNARLYDFLTGEAFEQAVAVSSCFAVTLESGVKGMCAPSKFYSYLQGGKPVISVTEPDSYLAHEVEESGIGHAVAIGDTQALIGAIEHMAGDAGTTAQMGRRAEERYRALYAAEIGLGKYAELFKSMG